jgi:ABC-type phosphate/phosphonate transport system substrate-binding protein
MILFRQAAFLTILLLIFAVSSDAQRRLAFIGVSLDQETRQADRKLQEYLYRKAEVNFAPEELEYERVIDRLANWTPAEPYYVARVTPYVYVAAEMLGAHFEILATYVSVTTGHRTYYSYLVVNREDFPSEPTLTDILRFLSRKNRPRFIYHSTLSTSSFFVPSLYFRANKVFHMPESTESLIAVSSEKISENSSSKLVEMVADGQAELAAVWDGTKSKFEPGHPSGLFEQFGKKVYFVQLPTAIPNDLLVCSSSLDSEIKERTRKAISSMSTDEIKIGDFLTWQNIRDAADARAALASLRWFAREQVAPVTVEMRLEKTSADAQSILESARQAVRLSGTEFVPFDEDFHQQIDFVWTLEPIHDGAVLLRSSMPGSGIPDQTFQISFKDFQDLTRRIVSVIHSSLHRIRYVWPYGGNPPIVIRDMAFTLPPDSLVKIQKVSWLDPQKNNFRAGPITDAKIRESDFYKYELDVKDTSQIGDQSVFDPMSNVSFRVFLLRVSKEGLLFRVLTIAFLTLLVAAAVGLVVDFRRTRNARE